jgi:hypothetical protein
MADRDGRENAHDDKSGPTTPVIGSNAVLIDAVKPNEEAPFNVQMFWLAVWMVK